MITLTQKQPVGRFALFYLGFRPFFMGASLFAVVAMVVWTALYVYNINPPWFVTAPMHWHAHEMLYGYALAVIAGFLLTAVKNWTGIQTAHRGALAVLFTLWLVPRVLMLTGQLTYIWVFEALFMLALLLAVGVPLVRARQRQQAMIMIVLLLLAAGDVLFYMGVWFFNPLWQSLGITLGLYTVLLLIFFMARRVVPFFIERGVGAPVTIKNYRWLDIAAIALFVLFAVMQMLERWPAFTAVLAGVQFVLHLIRMKTWYTPQLWRKPLLWGLYLAYAWLVAGFLLHALAYITSVSSSLAIHAFAAGGIGLMTVAMMARVTLGHTGRDVAHPPVLSIASVLGLLMLAALARVALPLMWPAYYSLWIGASGLLWVAAFSVFFLRFAGMWTRPRVDGHYG